MLAPATVSPTKPGQCNPASPAAPHDRGLNLYFAFHHHRPRGYQGPLGTNSGEHRHARPDCRCRRRAAIPLSASGGAVTVRDVLGPGGRVLALPLGTYTKSPVSGSNMVVSQFRLVPCGLATGGSASLNPSGCCSRSDTRKGPVRNEDNLAVRTPEISVEVLEKPGLAKQRSCQERGSDKADDRRPLIDSRARRSPRSVTRRARSGKGLNGDRPSRRPASRRASSRDR